VAKELKKSDVVIGAVAVTNLSQERLVKSLTVRVKEVIEEMNTIVALLDLLQRRKK